jgi:hypothetical protein
VDSLRMSNSRSGISMIESTIATLLVGSVIASTLGVVGPVLRSSQLAEDQVIAQRLVDDLIQEISVLPFDDPELIAAVDAKGGADDLNNVASLSKIGPDSGERTSIRTDFDDVDDYEGWFSVSPTDKNGVAYPGKGFTGRQVFVDHVSLKDFRTVSVKRTGAKLIRVMVVFNSIPLAEESFIRTESWDSMRSSD